MLWKGSLFTTKVDQLRNQFPFGSWKDAQQETITFCGCEISQNQDSSVEVNQERYSEGISEIQISNQRKLEAYQLITEGERKQLRAVLGALSWRSTQSAPWLCASVSFLQGCMKNAVVQDLIDVNKLVRTQRQYNNVPLYFPSNSESQC